jgi:hypothetical protein
MAISFIAGYNVELLFSYMDRIIQELSKRTKPEETAAPIQSYTEPQVQYQAVPEK